MEEMERKKQSRSSTVPRPFKFCESKKDLNLLNYMNNANKPWEALGRVRKEKGPITSLQKPKSNPPSTLKTDGAMQKRRYEMEEKLYNEE